MDTNPDWKQPLPPFSPNDGTIEGRGILTFFPWAVIPTSFPNVTLGRFRAMVLYLQLLAEPTTIDINVNYNPEKLFLGRYTQMSGNFVINEGFVNHRNMVVQFSEQFTRIATGLAPTVNRNVFELNAYWGNTLFSTYELINSELATVLVAAPIYQFAYDLTPGVIFRYGWF